MHYARMQDSLHQIVLSCSFNSCLILLFLQEVQKICQVFKFSSKANKGALFEKQESSKFSAEALKIYSILLNFLSKCHLRLQPLEGQIFEKTTHFQQIKANFAINQTESAMISFQSKDHCTLQSTLNHCGSQGQIKTTAF